MDVQILIGVLSTLLASTTAITVTDTPPTESPFVPGVFIAADTLKNLQDQAKSESNAGPSKTQGKSDQTTLPNNEQNQGYQQIPDQTMNQPMGNQQMYPNQQIAYPNQQITNQQYPNQQYPNQQYPNQQYLNQQYPNQQYLNQQYPNQQYPNQPQVYGNQPIGYGNQQGMLLMQPGYQQNGQNPRAFLLNNPVYQQQYQNPQGGVYSPQQAYNQQQPNMAQPNLLAQPSQPLFYPNGQFNQPNMVANPNLAGQPTMLTNSPSNGASYTNSAQSPGSLYALFPVNGQNNMANPNLGNNNAYFVPVQQMPANTLLRDKARK